MFAFWLSLDYRLDSEKTIMLQVEASYCEKCYRFLRETNGRYHEGGFKFTSTVGILQREIFAIVPVAIEELQNFVWACISKTKSGYKW